MGIRVGIQPEQLVEALYRANEGKPVAATHEGDVQVLVNPVNTEGGGTQIRFCALGWDGGNARILSGNLPATIPERVTFAEGLTWSSPKSGPAVLDIHYNGTLHVTKISDPDPALLAV